MKYIIPIIIVGVLIFYFFLPASKDEDASTKIEILLNNLVESAERKNIDVVMEYFSPDYKDSYGRNYLELRDIINSAFERFDSIETGYSDLIVSTTENEDGKNQTMANLDVWVKGTRDGASYKLIGTQDNPTNINIIFESVMFGGWKILNVEGLKRNKGAQN